MFVTNFFNIADIHKQTGFAYCFKYRDNKTVVYICKRVIAFSVRNKYNKVDRCMYKTE